MQSVVAFTPQFWPQVRASFQEGQTLSLSYGSLQFLYQEGLGFETCPDVFVGLVAMQPHQTILPIKAGDFEGCAAPTANISCRPEYFHPKLRREPGNQVSEGSTSRAAFHNKGPQLVLVSLRRCYGLHFQCFP